MEDLALAGTSKELNKKPMKDQGAADGGKRSNREPNNGNQPQRTGVIMQDITGLGIPKAMLETGQSLHTHSGSKQVGILSSQARMESQEIKQFIDEERQNVNNIDIQDPSGRAHPSVRVTSKQVRQGGSYGPSMAKNKIIRETSQGPSVNTQKSMKLHPRATYGGGGGAIRKVQDRQQFAQFPMKVQNLNSLVQIRKKRPKMKYNERVAFQAEQEIRQYSQQIQTRVAAGKKFEKMLDGFFLLYSCRVKIPNQAIKSNLSGQNIVDVKEEDLVYFTNLSHLDISDNNVLLSQLLNLISLEVLDMQYNNLNQLQLNEGCFPKLHSLNLSYNKIPPSHLQELGCLRRLQCLEIASNDLCTLPGNLSFFSVLEELNLSSNNFSSDSVLVNPNQLIFALSTIPNLRKLNLSRNKLSSFHSENLQTGDQEVQQGFSCLEELDMSFNVVENQQELFYCASSMQNLRVLVVTGNPFAITGEPQKFQLLENMILSSGGQMVNETLNAPSYLKKGLNQRSRPQTQQQPLMITAGPSQPQQLIQTKQDEKELFQGMIENKEEEFQSSQQHQIEQEQQPDEQAFFLTENIGQEQQPTGVNFDNEVNNADIFDEDFGKMKMEIFKQKCRNILDIDLGNSRPQSKQQQQYPAEQQMMMNGDLYVEDEDEYNEDSVETEQVDIITAYKSLKLAMNKNMKGLGDAVQVNSNKGYLKPTMTTRQAQRQKAGLPPLSAQTQDSFSMIPRGHTAPAQTNVMNLRTNSQKSKNRVKGLDGKLLNSQTVQGMTLQDYAMGGAWGQGVLGSSAGTNGIGSQQGSRKATAPCWRKPKNVRVDERVERLRATYAEASKGGGNPLLQTDSQKRFELEQKYFPGKDIPLGHRDIPTLEGMDEA